MLFAVDIILLSGLHGLVFVGLCILAGSVIISKAIKGRGNSGDN